LVLKTAVRDHFAFNARCGDERYSSEMAAEVSIRDLRNHGRAIIDRVARGERLTITRSGKTVAELNPVGRTPLTAEGLIARWRNLPAVDPRRLRDDIDGLGVVTVPHPDKSGAAT